MLVVHLARQRQALLETDPCLLVAALPMRERAKAMPQPGNGRFVLQSTNERQTLLKACPRRRVIVLLVGQRPGCKQRPRSQIGGCFVTLGKRTLQAGASLSRMSAHVPEPREGDGQSQPL